MEIALSDRYALSIEQASQYFNIGTKKLRKLVQDYADSCDWLLMNGVKVLIKRKQFEKFLDGLTSI